MSKSVNFEGVSLVRASAVTKINANLATGPALFGSRRLGFIGPAKGGQPHTVKEWTNLSAALEEFYDGDMYDALRAAFNASDDPIVAGLPEKIYTYKTNNSTQSTLTLQRTSAPLAASHTLTNAGPYAMLPGDTFNVASDQVASTGVVFDAVQASAVGTAPPTLPMANELLRISVNGGADVDIQFGTEGTLAAVINTINSKLTGAYALDSGGNLVIESTLYGSNSVIDVTAHPVSDANAKLNLPTGPQASPGPNDVADISAVTQAELKARVEADTTSFVLVDITGSFPVISSPTIGATSTLTIAASTPATLNTTLGATAGAYTGAASGAGVDIVRLDSKNYGTHTNGITITAIDPAPTSRKRTVTITHNIDGRQVSSVSPELGGLRRFSIDHIGAGVTTATMSINSTQLVLTTDVPAQNLTLELADYDSLDALLSRVKVSPYYAVTNEYPLNNLMDSEDLDWVTNVDLNTGTPVDVYADVYDVVTWINKSDLIQATRLTTGTEIFDSFTTAKALLGAADGAETNADYTNGLNALANYHLNTIVPIISEDNTTGSNNVVFSAVAVACAAHCKEKSDISPTQDERRCWIGAKGTKTEQLALRDLLLPYDRYVTQCADRQKLPKGRRGTLTFLPEWSTAVLGSAIRAGLEIGEPVVNKILKSYGIERDWNPATPGEMDELILNGLTLTYKDTDDGLHKFDRVLTLYPEDNNALREESVFSGLLVFAYEWRKGIERMFKGRKGTLTNAAGIKAESESIFARFGPREQGGVDFLIVSTDENGEQVMPYRNLIVEIGQAPYKSDVCVMQVEVTVVDGINFILQTMAASPGALSVTA